MARTKILGTFLDFSSSNIEVTSDSSSFIRNSTDNDLKFTFVTNNSSDFAQLIMDGKDGGSEKFMIAYGSTHGSTPNMLALKSNDSSAGSVGFFTASTERARFDVNGRFGIGTTSPSLALEVNDTSNVDGEQISIKGHANYGGTVVFRRGDSFNWRVGVGGGSSTNSTIPSSYFGFEQGNTASMVIAHTTGNVGIGDTTPLTKLEVDGSIKATNRSTGHTGEAGVTLSYNTSSNIALLETWQSKPLVIDTFNYQQFNIGNSEAMKIDGTTRNVTIGAGTIFENERLNIKKTGSNDDAVLALDHDTGDASFYRFVRFYKKNANESLGKIDYDASGDAMTLAVESDERYKTITGPADGMNLISKLNPIKYTRPTKGVTDGCGFGAQSYKQAFDDIGAYPRGLTVGSDTEKWMLDFAPLVPNLVKALQEQQALIDALEARIKALESE